MDEFWWGEVADQRHIRWQSWSKLCLSKEEGGMGFKDFKAFNQALLAKQSCRILMEPDLLLSHLLKGKYFTSQCFQNASKRSNPSWRRQSILHGQDLLMQGLMWHSGSRPMLSIFERPWIHRKSNPAFPTLLHPFPPGTVIHNSSLIVAGNWDIGRLSVLFHPNSVQAITSIPLPIPAQPYHPLWYFSTNGQYTTSSGYCEGSPC
ncbi:Uncharacterized mitochondrial protein AtMg00310 [Linum perenne]